MANQIVVGQYGMSPQQMETAGIIKPGTSGLVQSLVDKGASLATAMPPSIFTGKQGAQDLSTFISNPNSQTQALATNLSKGQSALEQAGVITGKESPTQIAGLVKSTATVGVSDTISAVKNAAGGIAGAVGGAVAGALGGVGGALGAANKALGAIGSGNLAGQLADGLTSGLGSLKNSLAGLASAKGLTDIKAAADGVAAGAFNSIKNAFPKMPAGVPVNVAEVAKKAAQEAEQASTTIPGSLTNPLSSAKTGMGGLSDLGKSLSSGLQNQLSGGLGALGKSLPGAGGAMADFQNAAGKVLGSNKPSLLGSLSQIASTAASITPNAKGGAILGAVSGITGAISSKSGSVTNALSSGIQGAISGAASGAINSVLDKATGGVSSKILSTATVINSITGTTPTGAVNAFGGATKLIGGVAGAVGGTIAGGVSSLASGLTNLPGGAGAAGALFNNAKGLTSALGGAAGALGKLSGAVGGALAGAAGLAGTIANTASGLLNNTKLPTLDAASALAKSGLPSGAAAQLEAQISSIGSGGSVPISMPVIALNTTDRSEIMGQIDTLLGDPGIPPPNQLGEVSETTVSEYDQATMDYSDKLDECSKLGQEWLDLQDKATALFSKYDKAKSSLPQGDPQIESLRQEALAAFDESNAKRDAFRECQQNLGIG